MGLVNSSYSLFQFFHSHTHKHQRMNQYGFMRFLNEKSKKEVDHHHGASPLKRQFPWVVLTLAIAPLIIIAMTCYFLDIHTGQTLNIHQFLIISLCCSFAVNIYLIVSRNWKKDDKSSNDDHMAKKNKQQDKNLDFKDSNKYQNVRSKRKPSKEEENVKINKQDLRYEVICADAIQWIQSLDGEIPGYVITSMPDVCETQMKLEDWKIWFKNACKLILQRMATDSIAIFYQTDIKISDKSGKEVIEWVDKGYLCQRAAEEVPGIRLLWHKIMLLTDVGKVKIGRPTYTHLLCFTNSLNDSLQKWHVPDVEHRGEMLWPRAMGLKACHIAVQYCKNMGAKTIVDPFCGKGTVLMMANYFGLDAIGVDLAAKRVRNAISAKNNQYDQFMKYIHNENSTK